ncbi:26277_t:CDS:2, partial [Racocetra persica]
LFQNLTEGSDRENLMRLLRMKNKKTQVHERLIAKLSEADVKNLVEENYDRECIARNVTDVLLQEAKSNEFYKVLRDSENTKMPLLPPECDVEVTRGERKVLPVKTEIATEQ